MKQDPAKRDKKNVPAETKSKIAFRAFLEEVSEEVSVAGVKVKVEDVGVALGVKLSPTAKVLVHGGLELLGQLLIAQERNNG